MKIGTIETVSVNLNLITDPIMIRSSKQSDSKIMMVGNDPNDKAQCIESKTYGKPGGGNTNNAKRGRQQRRRKSARN
jgi:hypothetical protein